MVARAQTPSREMIVPAPMLPVGVSSMQAMASKMWKPFIGMGFMVVVAALIIGVIASVSAADYFSFSKLAREAATTGSDLATEKAFIESTKAWLLPLEILGIATFLFGFGFAFANILKNIRLRGATMAAVLPALKERKAGS